jgi:hypothetical protein
MCANRHILRPRGLKILEKKILGGKHEISIVYENIGTIHKLWTITCKMGHYLLYNITENRDILPTYGK